jgi:hypothetical protein
LKIVVVEQFSCSCVHEQNNDHCANDRNGHITLFHSIAGS